jgi:hypothetical protein
MLFVGGGQAAVIVVTLLFSSSGFQTGQHGFCRAVVFSKALLLQLYHCLPGRRLFMEV